MFEQWLLRAMNESSPWLQDLDSESGQLAHRPIRRKVNRRKRRTQRTHDDRTQCTHDDRMRSKAKFVLNTIQKLIPKNWKLTKAKSSAMRALREMKCCVCEESIPDHSIKHGLIPSKCRSLHGQISHRLCTERCWFIFAEEKRNHQCPGCIMGKPLFPKPPPQPSRPVDIDIIDISD